MNQANLSLCDNNVAASVVRAVPKKPLANLEKKNQKQTTIPLPKKTRKKETNKNP